MRAGDERQQIYKDARNGFDGLGAASQRSGLQQAQFTVS